MDYATKLRTSRRELKLTQHEVAQKINVSDGAYAMYETGERMPRDDVKIKIAQLFNKPVGYLFFDENTYNR